MSRDNRQTITTTSMMTTSEVAVLLNVHINTVRRWSRQGVLKAFQLSSRGDLRFYQEDINAFIAGNGHRKQEQGQ